MSAPAVPRASYEGYLALGEDVRAEYIDERIVMSPVSVSFGIGEALVDVAALLG